MEAKDSDVECVRALGINPPSNSSKSESSSSSSSCAAAGLGCFWACDGLGSADVEGVLVFAFSVVFFSAVVDVCSAGVSSRGSTAGGADEEAMLSDWLRKGSKHR
ncbi:hypothetical protein P170DRAFT_116250 [Aspergillus steynii IBT 23096]|uniref:Uncharacterized protein n=1 Tax=Aspergillus steynii IBT 23096 TaxID=1392250 RepID=A0A2I2GJ52_9EURO|nr:uncharacterized protein P170DRAFT_116250 [Aspergillus steynii IBT 23096]PLB52906.1 hypothetical protein P170DRAFT_116250 [Aspergillus steynii IBT 23096]